MALPSRADGKGGVLTMLCLPRQAYFQHLRIGQSSDWVMLAGNFSA